ncbi:Nucleoside diphosphate kinase 6 [Toxocara canis]|uniref:Nucleoside diphosphate kinase 6 n=1 Tax=Toxocara canis TaxID=6265 RepID=A0A0B2UX90_TOXCA|nr:Nucleoside diphosphate kinase 6 [Toxocara canis]KHN73713.1 Nucleoside diphosphate kinase 6 [Toxocara canis]
MAVGYSNRLEQATRRGSSSNKPSLGWCASEVRRLCVLSHSIVSLNENCFADKFFYERLIRHVTSGPVIVMQLRSESDDAIEHWRNLMGPSKLLKSMEDPKRESLRAQFAISDTRNLVHGADSQQSAVSEMQLFAPYPPLHLSELLAHPFE